MYEEVQGAESQLQGEEGVEESKREEGRRAFFEWREKAVACEKEDVPKKISERIFNIHNIKCEGRKANIDL